MASKQQARSRVHPYQRPPEWTLGEILAKIDVATAKLLRDNRGIPVIPRDPQGTSATSRVYQAWPVSDADARKLAQLIALGIYAAYHRASSWLADRDRLRGPVYGDEAQTATTTVHTTAIFREVKNTLMDTVKNAPSGHELLRQWGATVPGPHLQPAGWLHENFPVLARKFPIALERDAYIMPKSDLFAIRSELASILSGSILPVDDRKVPITPRIGAYDDGYPEDSTSAQLLALEIAVRHLLRYYEATVDTENEMSRASFSKTAEILHTNTQSRDGLVILAEWGAAQTGTRPRPDWFLRRHFPECKDHVVKIDSAAYLNPPDTDYSDYYVDGSMD
jgi:hypothetical protein